MTQEILVENPIEVPMTIPEAAKKFKISAEAIHTAIQRCRLKSCKFKDKNYLLHRDVEEYLQSKFSLDIKRAGGHLLCDPEKKEMTALQAARYMKVSLQQVYNLIRRGVLPCQKKSKFWVLTEPDIIAYLESKEDKQQMRFA
jgi:predicted DNA-binding protein YlxM (UPF0122 family)